MSAIIHALTFTGLLPLIILPIFYYEYRLGKPSTIQSLPRRAGFVLAYVLGPGVLMTSWLLLFSVLTDSLSSWWDWKSLFFLVTVWPTVSFPCLLRLTAPLRALSPSRRAVGSITAFALAIGIPIVAGLFFPFSRDSITWGGVQVAPSLLMVLFEAFLFDVGIAVSMTVSRLLSRRRTGGQEPKAPADTGGGKSQEERAMGEH